MRRREEPHVDQEQERVPGKARWDGRYKNRLYGVVWCWVGVAVNGASSVLDAIWTINCTEMNAKRIDKTSTW